MRGHPRGADAAGARVELAEVFERHGARFRAAHRLSAVQYRAMRAIQACRTPALGGHVTQCDTCGAVRYTYHSCGNRHCPKCQTLAKERWLSRQRAELLAVPYFHLVFTLPHALNALAQGNARAIYTVLFQAASDTLIEFGENPRWLGGTISTTMVLHTWGQNLGQHLHVHCLVAAGALHANGHWIHPRKGFLFPVKALSQVFRGKFLCALARLFDAATLQLAGSTAELGHPQAQRRLYARLREHDWVVYAKRPFAGPEQVLGYLGRYTHRVALSNNRLVSVDEHAVCFRYKDYAHGNRQKLMRLAPEEFIRRFLLHVLPKGFMRIRHYGLSANRAKQIRLAQARAVLDQPPLTTSAPESVSAFWLRIARLDIERCPHCHRGHMRLVHPLAALRARAQPPPR